MPEHDPIVVYLVCLWFAVFGASIGSFLNVAVYRLPRGKSLVHPPSFCPRCGRFIRWYDNVPVFGWLKLRGKCRDCRLPISMRYPCIEGFCGVLFGGVFLWITEHFRASLVFAGGITLLVALSLTLVLAGLLIMFDYRTK